MKFLSLFAIFENSGQLLGFLSGHEEMFSMPVLLAFVPHFFEQVAENDLSFCCHWSEFRQLQIVLIRLS